ncbi:MAG: hypothetical protein IT446_07505 [Phycisphaerales bacterium]|nr:hypothetical protein [Phycisphaerales bacterium]
MIETRPHSTTPSQRTAAFTLVKLLVVIGIIALLISILMPALSRAREAANQVACASNMRQWATSVVAYSTDNKGWLPMFGETYGYNGPEPTLWWNTLAPYLGKQPTNAGGYYPSQAANLETMAKIRGCPSDPDHTFVGPNYGGFAYADGRLYGPIVWGRYDPSEAVIGVRITRIKQSGSKILFAETTSPYYQVYSPENWVFDTDCDGDGINDTYNYYLGWNNYNGGRPKVHHGSSNVAFCDGHVESMPYKTWLTDMSYWTVNK